MLFRFIIRKYMLILSQVLVLVTFIFIFKCTETTLFATCGVIRHRTFVLQLSSPICTFALRTAVKTFASKVTCKSIVLTSLCAPWQWHGQLLVFTLNKELLDLYYRKKINLKTPKELVEKEDYYCIMKRVTPFTIHSF